MLELIEKLKSQIIEHLGIEDISVEDLDADESLYEGPLGLDSIDVLELIVLLEKDYNVKIANAEVGKTVFINLRTIADFITSPEKYQ